jgi:hypothetical protein
MSTTIARAFIAACICASIALAGCSHKTTIQTSQGSVTVDQGANSTTIKTKDGEVAYGKGAVDPSSLGLPVYPGAASSDQGVSIADGSKAQGAKVALLTTTDSFDKVYDYYKSQLPAGSEKSKVEAGDTQLATFEIGADTNDEKSVTITGSKDKVSISLTHITKN